MLGHFLKLSKGQISKADCPRDGGLFTPKPTMQVYIQQVINKYLWNEINNYSSDYSRFEE